MDRVKAMADGMVGVNVFSPSKDALTQWEQLTKGGTRLSDDAVQGTMLFKENQTWINKMKKDGVTIMDIGADKTGTTSTFYEMEKKTVYNGN